jgi:transposase
MRAHDLAIRGMSTRQAARIIGISARTLRRIIARGAPILHDGEDLTAWLGPPLPRSSPIRQAAEERLQSPPDPVADWEE